jgi:HAD superfamily hydrolase (TIGR01509 family)
MEAILLDCLGTLLALEEPAPKLAAATGAPPADAERAMRAEIAYYREHMHTMPLAELRAGCAAVVARELGMDVTVEQLLSVLSFTPYPDVRPALDRWRARGLRLVVVSNWDESLPETLTRAGLAVDGVVTSAAVGAAKPDPAPVRAALEIAGTSAALLVGDSPEDAEAARAAGVRSVILDRPAVTLADIDPYLEP